MGGLWVSVGSHPRLHAVAPLGLKSNEGTTVVHRYVRIPKLSSSNCRL